MDDSGVMTDFWREFKALHIARKNCSSSASSPKKATVVELLNKYQRLLQTIKESEAPEQAAHCHSEIAVLYALLPGENGAAECRHLLKAGALFFEAEKWWRQKMNFSICSESGTLAEECYARAAAKFLGPMASPKMTTLAYTELGAKLFALDRFPKAFSYYQKAASLVKDDVFALAEICEKLCKIVPKLDFPEEAILDTHKHWTRILAAPHNDFSFEPLRRQLLQLELKIVLLSLIHCKRSGTILEGFPPLQPYHNLQQHQHQNPSSSSASARNASKNAGSTAPKKSVASDDECALFAGLIQNVSSLSLRKTENGNDKSLEALFSKAFPQQQRGGDDAKFVRFLCSELKNL